VNDKLRCEMERIRAGLSMPRRSAPSLIRAIPLLAQIRRRVRSPKGFHWVPFQVEALDCARECVKRGHKQAGDLMVNLLARIAEPWAHEVAFEVEATMAELARELRCDKRRIASLIKALEATNVFVVIRTGNRLRFRFTWGSKGFENPDLKRPDVALVSRLDAPHRRQRSSGAARESPPETGGQCHSSDQPVDNSAKSDAPKTYELGDGPRDAEAERGEGDQGQ
jgi:hypothetical protein